MDSTLVAVFLVAFVLIALAVGGMAMGSRMTGRCLRGSCGGPAVVGKDGKEIGSCAGCPNRKP
ncbi:MAG TPA: hypothetical protein VFV55_04630 [Usitatibacteraceae bacterium]|nr:hypothetical protein [Usitatibacteraceae bacterium]